MAFSDLIENALKEYDKNKGFFRKTPWLSWLFGRDARAIRALRKLQPCYQNSTFSIFNCFIKNRVKKTQASYSVFQVFIQDQFSKAPSSNCDADLYLDIGLKLNKSKIFTEQNIKAIQQHPNFNELAIALHALHKEKNLNQAFFNAIKKAPDPVTVTEMLLLCKKKSLLNDQNKNTIITHYRSLKLIRNILEKRNISFYEHLEPIINHRYLPQLCMALQALEEARRPNSELGSLINHPTMTKHDLLVLYSKWTFQENSEINPVPTTSDNSHKNNKITPQRSADFFDRSNVLSRLTHDDEPTIENKNGQSGENITQPLFSR